MKTVLFFCDIRGTITGTTDYQELMEKLDKLREIYNCEKIIFSIVSSENMYTVEEYINRLNQNNDNIIFGKQFYDSGYIDCQNAIINEHIHDKTKLGQIIRYSQEVCENYDVDLICYADDNAYGAYVEVLNNLIKNVEIKVISPSNKNKQFGIISTQTEGIDGLYECLDIIIESKAMNNKRYNKRMHY